MAGHMRVHHGIEAPLTNLEPIEIEPIETPAKPEPDSKSDSDYNCLFCAHLLLPRVALQ
jgi:hypothetical protein